MNKKMLVIMVIPCALFSVVLHVAILFLHLRNYEQILDRQSRGLNMTEKSV